MSALKYLKRIPSVADIPAGMVVVHNHVRPTRQLACAASVHGCRCLTMSSKCAHAHGHTSCQCTTGFDASCYGAKDEGRGAAFGSRCRLRFASANGDRALCINTGCAPKAGRTALKDHIAVRRNGTLVLYQ